MKEYTVKIPKWLTKKLLLSVFLIVAAGVGCFYWGMWSTDINGEINDYLLSEQAELQRGRNAGYMVALVGNETFSTAWIDFCDGVIDDCIGILQEQKEGGKYEQ